MHEINSKKNELIYKYFVHFSNQKTHHHEQHINGLSEQKAAPK